MYYRLQRIVFPVLCVFLILSAAGAMETNSKKDAPPSNEIEMPFIVCPATRDGRLIGYYYISYRMVTPSSEEASDIKGKLAILQDAYVRAVYKHDVFQEDHPEKFNKDAFQTIIINTTKTLVRADQVTGIIVRAIKYAPLHPSMSKQVPQAQAVKPATPREPKASAHKKAGGH